MASVAPLLLHLLLLLLAVIPSWLSGSATAAAATCPPPLVLSLGTISTSSRTWTRVNKNLKIGAVVRNTGNVLLTDVNLKIALPPGLCPIKTSAKPTSKPLQRPAIEGTAAGSVNVYWVGMHFRPGKTRKFKIQTVVTRNVTSVAAPAVEALAWLGNDTCTVAAEPLNVRGRMRGLKWVSSQ